MAHVFVEDGRIHGWHARDAIGVDRIHPIPGRYGHADDRFFARFRLAFSG
jgi:hypothetical protein